MPSEDHGRKCGWRYRSQDKAFFRSRFDQVDRAGAHNCGLHGIGVIDARLRGAFNNQFWLRDLLQDKFLIPSTSMAQA